MHSIAELPPLEVKLLVFNTKRFQYVKKNVEIKPFQNQFFS